MVLLLHGAVADGSLLMWGETPRSAKQRAIRRRRGSKSAIPTSPFDAGTEALVAATREGGLFVVDVPVRQVALFLPSREGRPLASSPLIEDPDERTGEMSLEAWRVWALDFPLAQAIEPLCACLGKRMLWPGIIVADDLAFWTMALRFVGALVAGQAYLPDVARAKTGFTARWRPVLGGREAEEMIRLAAAMPAACRAASPADAQAAPSTPSATVLAGFVDHILDALVRRARPGAIVAAADPPSLRRQSRRAVDPAHAVAVDQRWLAALHAPNALIDGPPAEVSELAGRLRDWHRPITSALASPFRLCFRIEEPVVEPPEDDSPRAADSAASVWFVRYLLQSNRDPSLLIPAPEAWSRSGPAKTLLRVDGFDARSFLLLTLGQAGRLDPAIRASLGARVPDGYQTDADGAAVFLTQRAAVLREAGFGVMLPAWWTGRGTAMRLATRAKVRAPVMQGGGGLSLDQVVRFEWQVALGDQMVSRAELEALARLKAPLVRVRGRWVLVDPQEIRGALQHLDRRGTLTARDVLRLGLDPREAADGAPNGVEVEGWIADLLDRLRRRETLGEIAAPPSFRGSLRPYQARGYAWLRFLRQWGLGACLADDMGLGKTIQTLVHLQQDKDAATNARGKRPIVLLVCPTSVIGNWQREASRFTPNLKVMVHHGGERARGASLRKEVLRHDLMITSYTLLQRDAEALGMIQWTGVILDEAQNIKNPATKQARAARGITCEYRVALTGTPVENNVGELWSLMAFLNPGLLGSESDFKRRFFVPIQASREPRAIERLRTLTGPFILRRLKTDPSVITDLPAKLEMKVTCTLTREQASLYAAVVEDAAEAIGTADGIRRRGLVLATLSKLKQVCNHPAQFLGDNSPILGRSGKLARLTEMLEEILEVGERTLVFTQFSEMGKIIKSHLEGMFGEEVLFLHGGMGKPRRDRMVERFQAGDGSGPRMFLLSLKAGGTGLNLTAANHVFHFDRWWNPAVEDQATDRAFRIGQTRQVQVHKFLCAGTVEEAIDSMIERKKELAGALVGTGEDWLTKLSTAELRDLFALRDGAVAE
ncbi:MAG: DEAD/DEAH box helicase [Pseudomonadota bacterium]|nr:DEAD/DEAH box helicase [Pseudomonadota bacterium]